ncbi:lysine-specific demethylase JMJ17 isoform X2 [Ziziphus jujuba]|uniref:Lysine-specific demethylase JMJ17 isoform X2 n=1 Tax=Ziziphus jujuba TaxID=326968 RepID=A0A6P4ALV6_ZIZJJ|nr:lysine-specific demethylase JMJ17 isoform X2 [Ziziphus jujuba]
MGKGKPRAVEKGGLGQNLSVSASSSLSIPSGPVYYPTEDEFRDPLEYIYKIRPEAEPYGICKIVPPTSWKPPFALDLNSFTFPTKTQAIHQLQARPSSCDSKTFDLEYNRFLENHSGKKLRRKVVFEGEELDLCKLFNAAKRYGGYDKVTKEKKWGEVFRFVRSSSKLSECAKHVLSQLYREHLYDYEVYYNQLNQEVTKNCKRGMHGEKRSEHRAEHPSSKRRRRNVDGKFKVCKVEEVEEEEEEHDQICEQCRSGLHGEVMLLCDRCNKGWHIYCLSPPLKQVPLGNWYCLDCLNSDKDSFGFVPGKCYSLEAFRRMADRAKKKWFGSGSPSRVQIEKKFWEIVEGSLGEVEVLYGSDLDTSVYGSGFPRRSDQIPQSVENKEWDEYCGSPWNLNNLPKLEGSVLQAVHNNIAGVMVPWLYIGMLFSSFCWHFEDHCFYSMNYLHWGEPKCWYSVPGSEANAFEKVMRNCLPDLFDAQPDLLFQLVTMLNPSVLQENGVPVYSILQEPGNFVITFPRSYHGGFNLGLNCAEAVNFAPADWLPHGGFGAELYQLYHKTAVLSHEELLCVVAKGNSDNRVSPFLKKELLRIYAKEKTWRERLWKNGIVKSSQMSPRKCPEYVGTEEDSTCIICKQYLYLSAVVCRCRPSAFVCLEHWKNLCECKSGKLRLLYRQSLAELNDLIVEVDSHCSEETTHSRNIRRQTTCSSEPSSLTKKVKSGQVTLTQLAEQWRMRSSKIFQNRFSRDAYVTALKEAEQFLWAGSEMDPVRDMAKNLIEARKWAESVRACMSKIKNWPSHPSGSIEKVHMEYIDELLSTNPVPCNEPAYRKLKVYAEEARVLIQEIDTALSACSNISELENLYSRVCDLPINVKESEKLSKKISSAKAWMESVRKCVSEKCPAAIEVELLHKLMRETSELKFQFPETEMLLDLHRQAESCRARCDEILKGPISLKNVESLLQELDNFTVNVPELKLLRQYHADATLWISRFNDILVNIHAREDQHNVVDELNCLLKDGASLRIQVEQLPLVEFELKRACCREKALKARNSKMPLNFLQQVIMEAEGLQIEREKVFVDIVEVLAAAMRWEEKATYILAQEAEMSEFEDAIRSSEGICVILPSLNNVKEALSMAISWLENSKPFLVSCSSSFPASKPLLKFEALKELVSQSNLLKVTLKERRLLQTILNNCKEWEHDACSLLQDAVCLFDMANSGDFFGRISNIECLLTRIESAKRNGLSLGFDLTEIPKLEDACSTLQWCKKALSFCSVAPSFEDVENLMKVAGHLPSTFATGTWWSSLMSGVKWLQQASEIVSAPCSSKRCKLSDAEEVLASSQHVCVSFPMMVGQLESSIQKHKLWLEQVHQFSSLKPEERSWSLILELKEVGIDFAFNCSELDLVLSEVGKIEKWKQLCMDTLGTLIGDENSLLGALQKIGQTLDKSLYIYDKTWNSKVRDLCLCCLDDSLEQETLLCSVCKDCYHLRCLGPAVVDKYCTEVYKCPYCQYLVSGSVSHNGGGPLRFKGKRPELNMLRELLSNVDDFYVLIEEREILKQLVEKALACKTRLMEIVNSALTCVNKDLSVISGKLTTALKATEVAGVYDHQGFCNFELALARNSWKIRVAALLEGLNKPTIQQIQQQLKEGLALNIPPEDHYKQRLMEVKRVAMQWADYAKKVTTDSGALSLDKVYQLITEGENLPVSVEKELKLLRARSMLYCICRKPYDQRAMIACDRCDEWYHFDCIKLRFPPKIYICPACEPRRQELLTLPMGDHERLTDSKSVEPKTPSPQHTKPRKSPKIAELSSTRKTIGIAEAKGFSRFSGGIERLWWRNRKPFRRAAKKRVELESLSPFFHLQQ